MLNIWSDASPKLLGAKTNCDLQFQHEWISKEVRKHVNWLELRAARFALLQLASPRYIVQLYLNNMTAIAFIRKMGGTRSPSMCWESLWLWCQTIRRGLTILPP